MTEIALKGDDERMIKEMQRCHTKFTSERTGHVKKDIKLEMSPLPNQEIPVLLSGTYSDRQLHYC